MDDRMIIDLYWARSEDAISETDKKYGRFCYGLSFNILGDSLDAEECVSDTYMAAWDAMPPHRPGLLKAFLGKLSRRIAISRWRGKNAAKRKGMTELVLDELSDCVPGGCSPAEELELKELAAVIDGFLRSLPEAERLVFYPPLLVSRPHKGHLRALRLLSEQGEDHAVPNARCAQVQAERGGLHP
mgnify:CR=1 FL=1